MEENQDNNDNQQQGDNANSDGDSGRANYGSMSEQNALFREVNDNDDTNYMPIPENVRIHIVMNIAVILFDILFIFLAILFILFTGYRVPYLWGILTGANNNNNALANADFMDEYRDIFRQRTLILNTAFFIFIDIPCVIMAIIVFVTIWRAFKLYDLFKNQTNDAWDFRKHSWEQFCSLLRDIFFLIPFFIIVCTLFRLPMLVLALMAKLRTPRIKPEDDINLTVNAAAFELPLKGKPQIHIKSATKTA